MDRHVAVWALVALLAGGAAVARGQSAAGNADQGDAGAATKPKTVRSKDAPSDVRNLDPTREVPSEQNTDVGTPGAKRAEDSRKPAPSDVRELDPTRQVPGTENQDGGRSGDPGR